MYKKKLYIFFVFCFTFIFSQAQLTVSIVEPEENQISVCPGQEVDLEGEVNGGVPPYTYDWYTSSCPGNCFSEKNGTEATFLTASSGNYKIYFKAYDADSSNIGVDSIAVVVTTLPNVVAPADIDICQGDTVELCPAGDNLSLYHWEFLVDGIKDPTLGGFVANPGCYSLIPDTTMQASVKGYDNNGCYSSGQTQITVVILPDPNSGGDDSICETETYNFPNSSTNYFAGNVSWSHNGIDGVWIGPSNVLHPVYDPGPQDIQRGYVDFVIQGNGVSPCGTETDTMRLWLVGLPTADAGSNGEICSNEYFDITDADTTNSSGMQWSVVGGVANGFFNQNDELLPRFQPGMQAVIDARNNPPTYTTTVQIVITAQGHGSCSDATDTAIVTVKAAPDFFLTPTDISCNKNNNCLDPADCHDDGIMTATYAWGANPWHFQSSLGTLYPDNVSPVQEIDLDTGRYCFTLRHGVNTCFQVKCDTIQEPLELFANVVDTVKLCNGVADGYIIANPTGGNPIPPAMVYNFDWETEPPTNGLDSIGGLLAGTYDLLVTDNNGCFVDTNATITDPPELIVSLDDSQNVDCFGEATGSIDVSVVGGTPNYTYDWNPDAGQSQDTSNVAAGNYNVIVTDANGCTDQLDANVTISEPAAPIAVAEVLTHVTCNGGNDGEIDITVNGGTPPYTFDWSNGETTEDIDTLIADDYTIIVEDAAGCTDTVTYTIQEPLPIVVNIAKTDVLCNGDCNGELDVTVNGGTPGYTYLWGDGNVNEDRTNLCPNTYEVIVTDINGCEVTASESVDQPNPLNIQFNVTHITCNGDDDGAISAIANGGVGGYLYDWDPGNCADSDTSGLAPREYCLTVTDANGCFLQECETVIEPDVLVAAANVTQVTCHDDCDGAIDNDIEGGTQPYSYSWTHGPASEDLNALCSGTYDFTVTDANGCIANTSSEITNPDELTATLTPTDVSCFGYSDGQIDVTINGGQAPFDYSWSNGETTEDINNISVGNYCDTITDARGCQIVECQIINQPTEIQLSTSTTSPDPCGTNTGQIGVSAIGGAGNYSYQWGAASGNQVTQTAVNLFAGVYCVTVTDQDGCFNSICTPLNDQGGPIVTIQNVTDVLCYGDSTGVARANAAIGGTLPITYTWNTLPPQTGLTATGLYADTFAIQAVDVNGCTGFNFAVIDQPDSLQSNILGSNISCFGICDGAVDLTVQGGSQPIDFTWDNGTTTEDLNDVCADKYVVDIEDANGCTISDSIILTQPDALTLVWDSIKHNDCYQDSLGVLRVDVSNGTLPYIYSWNHDGALTDSIAKNLPAGIYTVIITDANGCSDSISDTITQPTEISIIGNVTNSRCNGSDNGAIETNISGGTPPYTYLWDNAEVTNDISGLAPATYCLTVTDNLTCTAQYCDSVAEPEVLTITLDEKSNITCNGLGNGYINVTVAGGTQPYTYIWSNGESTDDISGLEVGLYTLNVIDANGCGTSSSWNITEPQPIVLVLSSTDCNPCGSATGTASVNASGGIFPYNYEWNDPLNQVTSAANSLLAGNYCVTVTDANNCQEVGCIFVSDVNAPDITIDNIVGTTCYGDCDGISEITVNNGNPPYDYLWSSGEITEDANSLCGGNNNIAVTDAANCTSGQAIIVDEPDSIEIQFVVTDVTCNGNTDGEITANITGGSGGYTYIWSNGGNLATISNLSAGYYVLTVRDVNGCETVDSVEVEEPPELQLSVGSNSPSGCGLSDGNATVTPVGGTFPYNYQWDVAAGNQITQTANNLSAGIYQVLVQDANGCLDSIVATVSDAGGPVVNFTVAEPNCNGDADGQLTVNAVGAAPFNYQWDAAADNQITQTATGLAAGNYNVLVTGAGGCTTVQSGTVTEPNIMHISDLQISEPDCNGEANGSIIIETIVGGTPNYTVFWADLGVTNDTLENIPAGNYQLQITDANACPLDTTIQLSEPLALSLNLVSNNTSACGMFDGSVVAMPNGGTPNYTYNWPTIPANTQTVLNLEAGNYPVDVQDANGCTVSDIAVISDPNAPVFTVNHTDALCNGQANGTAAVVPANANFDYVWYNNSGGPFANTSAVTDLAAGNYSVEVEDINSNCIATKSVVINEPQPIQVTYNIDSVTCPGGSDGVIDITTVTGGVGNYEYNWDFAGYDLIDSITGIQDGAHVLYLRDSNNCVFTDFIVVLEPDAFSFNFNTTLPTACGNSDGEIEVTVNGGSPAYNYLWNTGNTTTNITNIGAGPYQVVVTDSKNCKDSASISLSDPSGPTITFTTQDPLCYADSNGQATANVSGGVLPYQVYFWNTVPQQTNLTATGLKEGNYVFTITDNANCTSTGVAVISEPNPIHPVFNIDSTLCFGSSDGAIVINQITGGTAPYSVDWGSGYAANMSYANLSAGNYPVSIKDANDCVYDTIIQIHSPDALQISMNITPTSFCGANDAQIQAVVSGGTNPYGYQWDDTQSQTTQSATGLSVGHYNVLVTDANGCTANAHAIINDISSPTITFNTVNVKCFGDSTGSIIAHGSDAVAPYIYYFNAPIDDSVQSVNQLPAGTYSVIVTDANGCSGTSQVDITQPDSIQLIVDSLQMVLCNGDNTGYIGAHAIGGILPYSFSWTGGYITDSIESLYAGMYVVSIEDSNNCIMQDSVEITEPTEMVLADSSFTTSGCGLSDGAGLVLVSGGTPNYTYQWDLAAGNQTDSFATGLSNGIYQVYVTDANMCIDSIMVAVSDSGGPDIFITSLNNAACNDVCNGSVSVSASGGNGSYTYSWDDLGETSQTVTGLCAGNYSLTVSDTGNCVSTIIVPIAQPTAFSINSIVTNVLCNGDSSGVIAVSVSGSTPPYNVSWNTGDTTLVLDSMPAGNYCIDIIDVNGCDTTLCYTITEPNDINVAISTTDVTNCGGSDGTAEANVSGGVSPYNYEWVDLGQTDSIATGLNAGIDTLIVTDANGCMETTLVAISEQNAPTVMVDSIENPLCFGDCNGSIAITASNGTSPYSYYWSPSGSVDSFATGLCNGQHTVEVVGADNCTAYKVITLQQPTSISIQPVSSEPRCYGDCNGEIVALVSGGVGGYQYNWVGQGVNINTLSNVCSGNYQIIVNDANGCTSSKSIFLSQPLPINISYSKTDALCNGSCNGTATANVTGGTMPYIYTWNDPLGQSGATANMLCADTFMVQVQDAYGCTPVSTPKVIINEPLPLVVSFNKQNVICYSDSNGTATALVTGGVGNYAYDWDLSPLIPQTTQTATGLVPGIYSVTVSDTNLCEVIANVQIEGPPAALVHNVSMDSVTCFGYSDGQLSVAASGGVAPYLYQWTGQGENSNEQVFDSLQAGIYYLSITDSFNCIVYDTVAVLQPLPIQVNETVTDISCYGDADGIAQVQASGGNAPYTYTWPNDGQSGSNASGLDIGTHLYVVTDSKGCKDSSTIYIDEPDSLYAQIVTYQHVSCYNGNNGAATVTVIGGTSPYNYQWSYGSATGDTINQLPYGRYTVKITDANGCEYLPDSVTITQPDTSLYINQVSVIQNLCYGDCEGQISLDVKGGTFPYYHQWNTQPVQNDAAIFNLCAGQYIDSIVDENGCLLVYSANITEEDSIYATFNVSDVLCYGDSTGSIVTTVNGGVPPYLYLWNTGEMIKDINNLSAGTYFVTITDSNHCTTQISVEVEEHHLQMDLSTIVPLCYGDCNGKAIAEPYNGFPPYSYLWINANNQTNDTAQGLCSDYYTVVVTDSANCKDTGTIFVDDATPIDLQMIDIVTVGLGYSVELQAFSTTQNLTYSWTPSWGLSATDIANPIATPGQTTMYYVYVTDQNGCTLMDSVLVKVVDNVGIVNTITPNGDGYNDVWVIEDIEYFPEVKVEIYTRWGQLIYQSNGYNTPFDGTYNGKLLPVGTYYYVIKLKPNSEAQTGYLNIFR